MSSFFKFTPPESYNFKISNSVNDSRLNVNKEKNLDSKLDVNLENLKELLHFPDSNDLVFRFFEIKINNTLYNALIIFYDGLVNSDIIDNYIIRQLIMGTSVETPPKKSILKKSNKPDIKKIVMGNILSQNQVTLAKNYSDLIDSVLHGDCALLIDDVNESFICDVKKIPSRSIEKSENEMNIKGPAEAFVENFRTNTSLIRKYVKDENLVFETLEVGIRSKTRCALAYITTIANESLINEVRNRISSIELDYLIDSGQLEQLIEDHTFVVEPLILNTERPDKVASNLFEGRIAILVEGSSDILVVPAVYSDFLRSSEDSYVRYPYSMLLRLFRIPAILLSIFLPGLYIAITSFHQEMIPTDLLFSIAGTREKVPFSMLTELIIMEIAFEIIREASIRTPEQVGTTLGIIGTLILRSSNRSCKYCKSRISYNCCFNWNKYLCSSKFLS